MMTRDLRRKRFSPFAPGRSVLGACLALSLGVAACENKPDAPVDVTSQQLSAAPGARAARLPGALPYDERADSPMTTTRPPRQIQRLSDDLPTTREHLAARGLLSQQEVQGKLPKQAQREPSVARAQADTTRPPADLAERYRRYEAQANVMATRVGATETGLPRAERRDALKRAIVIEGRR